MICPQVTEDASMGQATCTLLAAYGGKLHWVDLWAEMYQVHIIEEISTIYSAKAEDS